jgi:predicted kinase
LQVDVDETKGSLHDPEIKDGELTQEQWNAIYEQTDKQIETRLKSSQSVVDASRYFKKAERNKARLLARNLKADFVTIYIDTPESVARQRWLQNRRTQTRRDIPDADFQEIVAVLEPPTADESPMLFHFADDIERWISIHSDFLGIRIQNLNISSE